MSLPSNWVECQVQDFADVKGGKRLPKGSSFSKIKTSYPYIRVTDFSGGTVSTKDIRYLDQHTRESIASYTISKHDLYVSIAGTIGLVGTIPDELDNANLTENAAKVSSISGVDRVFLSYLLRSKDAQGSFKEKTVSTTQPKLALYKIRELCLWLPPLAEQKQIATKLDELLAQVDTLKTRLDAIPAILKRFRQSVLAAAVSGRLTEEWRGQAELVRWEGKTLIDVVQTKPRNGNSPKGVDYETPYRNLTLSATTQGYFVEDKYKYIDTDIPEDSYLWLKPGDVLIQRANSLEYVGVSALYKGPENRYVYPDLMMKCTPNEFIIGEYFHYCLLSQKVRKYFRDNATGTAGNMPKINQQTVCSAPIDLPPIEEQTEIVRRVEQLFTFVEQIEKRVIEAQSRIDNFTQSILAKAFRGELTAEWREQNPGLISGENSAELLLNRIKAQRQSVPLKTRTRKKRA